MKDSGNDWLQICPADWNIAHAKYFVSVGHGYDPKTKGDTPVYGSGAESFKTCGEYKEGPAVLLGRKGTIDKPLYVTKKYWNVDTAFDVKPIKQFNLQFYYYLASVFDYTRYITQTTVPSMTQSDYRNMSIPIPNHFEQTAIVSYLDSHCSAIDRTIKATQDSIEKLREYKTTLITRVVTKGLNHDVEMKDSGVKWIGDIPCNWNSYRMKYLLKTKLQYGANEAGVSYSDKLPRYIRITDIDTDTNCLKNDDMLSLNKEVAKPYLLKDKDILFARSGATVGKSFLYKIQYGEAAYAGYLIKAQADVRKALPEFIYYYTLSSYYDKWKDYIFTQATIQNINAKKYNDFVIALPSINEQQSIINYLDSECKSINNLIAKKQQLITKFTEYRRSLIYQAVTGKIDCREA